MRGRRLASLLRRAKRFSERMRQVVETNPSAESSRRWVWLNDLRIEFGGAMAGRAGIGAVGQGKQTEGVGLALQ